MWIEDEASVKEKLTLVEKYKLAGAGFWEKDRETSEILYKLKKQDIHELLFENGINIAHVPTWQKRGVCLYKKLEEELNPVGIHNNINTSKKIYVDLEMNLIK